MSDESNNTSLNEHLPASLRRPKKEPFKMIQFRIPLSWWEELSRLSQEFDQDVSVFLREATEDWLRRARKVHQNKSSVDGL